MLTWLEVRDFVVIEHASLNFGHGMTVITGETGAGKSIIIDALGILLGDRTSSDIVRLGSDHAEIQASFDLKDNAEANNWLEEQSLETKEGECLLRRLVFKNHPSKGFINGRSVPIHSLQEIGELLLDIHSQHEHHRLLRSGTQRTILDTYANSIDLADRVKTTFRELTNAQQQLENAKEVESQLEEKKNYLRHQIDDLTVLAPQPGELETLDINLKQLSNITQLTQGAWQIMQALDEQEDNSASAIIYRSTQDLLALSAYDSRMSEPAIQLEILYSQIQDITLDLRKWSSDYEPDPQKLEATEKRLAQLHEAARKYRVAPDELADLLAEFQKELETINESSSQVAIITKSISILEKKYDGLADELSINRQKAQLKLGHEVTQHLTELGLGQASFKILLSSRPEKQRGAYGHEAISFLISTNLDSEPEPLSKVASGGELSRISLAIQVAASHTDNIPSNIYDEIDVGIGGRIAEIVGNKLRLLAVDKQVICITHLPQVAVQGKDHVQITKLHDVETRIEINSLNAGERVEEIARMLGGLEITEKTRAHAEDMLRRASNK
ncbi:MAG: DNA repair protein RecN [Acidiferrobacteraceae bacterium]|nr:DNA repair protein RecN [Acidiferrobacteraceae bacterium]|tara:strand:- start:7278 stop:8954 length:1677 start_codon:yes stop_codon:yes gene_type:complete